MGKGRCAAETTHGGSAAKMEESCTRGRRPHRRGFRVPEKIGIASIGRLLFTSHRSFGREFRPLRVGRQEIYDRRFRVTPFLIHRECYVAKPRCAAGVGGESGFQVGDR